MSTIILIDFYQPSSSIRNDYESCDISKLQNSLRKTFSLKSREFVNFFSKKMMILNHVQHSTIPFIPSMKPMYDFSMDKDVATALVMRHGQEGLKNIHESLIDQELILKASSSDYFINPKTKSTSLSRNRNHVKELIHDIGAIYLFNIDRDILKDEEICRFALKCNPKSIEFILNQSLLDNREIMLTIVRQYGLALKYLGTSLKNDKEIVMAALLENPNAIRFVGANMLKDDDISIYSSKIDIELRFKLDTGRFLYLYSNLNNTLQEVRNQIKDKWGFTNFTLIRNFQTISVAENDKSLSELGIDSETIFSLHFRMRGG